MTTSSPLSLHSAIMKWLAHSEDVGSSSKAIALMAVGLDPAPFGGTPPYPHDGGDFGRCLRLLESVPETKAGLDKLAVDGGPVWAALIQNWSEIEQAYVYDESSVARGELGGRCHRLMRSIIEGAKRADRER